MPNNIYTVGLRNVGSYQVSGEPFVTGSNGLMAANFERKIEFPKVTKSITVINSSSAGDTGAELRVHFNSSSAGFVHQAIGHHYITIPDNKDAVTFNVKCKELYVSARGGSAGFELFAELTNIPTGSMYTLTGSGLTSEGPASEDG